MGTLSNLHFELRVEPGKGSFSLTDRLSGTETLRDARMLVDCRMDGKNRQFLSAGWQVLDEKSGTQSNPYHGLLQTIQFKIDGDGEGISFSLLFALCQERPLFLWKIAVHNQGTAPIEVERIEMLRAGGQSSQGSFQVSYATDPRYSFYSNGWQSWSYCGTYLPERTLRTTRLGFFQQPMVLNPGTPSLRQPGYFSADFFGAVCELTERRGLLLGFLSQKEHFGTLEALLYDRPSLRLWANGDGARLDPGASMETDWAVLAPFDLDDPEPFGEFFQAVSREHQVQLRRPIPTGWCSWYHYYTRITPETLRSNLEQLSRMKEELPLAGFQIDDGYQAQVGDWFDFKPAFAGGMAPLAREIQTAGLIPGLWLAPFILHPRARLAREHPDWLLRDEKGRAVNCGFGWNALTHGLDLTIPEALDYASRAVRTAAHEWGYPYLKLDFLYAAAVKGRYRDPTRTRAQVLRSGMQALREAAGPQTFLVGCGAPLGSVIGLVDSMRVGEDVSGDWHPHFHGLGLGIRNEPFMPSVRNAIHNTLTRSGLHNRWWINDPDCLLLRPGTNLTLAEVQTLTTAIALSGGALLLSDDLSELPEERRRMAQVLLPLIGQRPQVIDLFDESSPGRLRLDLDGPTGRWHLLARFNWGDRPLAWTFQPEDYRLETRAYWLRSFWDGSITQLDPNGTVNMPPLPAHGCALIAVRRRDGVHPAYIGSDLHVSQGLEVARWQPAAGGLELEMNLPRRAIGNIYLGLPRQPDRATINGNVMNWSEVLPAIFQFPTVFDRKATIEV
jgi:alpha-galactosidase